jgi:replicative DNA helicase
LKGLAKELDIPLIALSQLSRSVESRKEKMPQLSDLRESGAIEQDADIVMFMYRPEYYDIHVNENGDNMNGETHIKFAKHRNGALDTIKLRASLATQQFYDFVEQPKQLGLTGKFRPVSASEKISDEENPF